MAGSDDKDLDATFHALADPTRRAILDELAKRDGQPLFEICVRLVEGRGMSLTRQAVSKHLTVLESADLVEVRWEGRTKLHSGKLSAHLPRLIGWLSKHEQEGDVECESS
ncbi:MAG: Transcriptional regulator, ArsR family [uncultured Rubrobacteraceae bacterium]|uniref:Transcriptional regulator, ArsR family n=1 Tax=uncultured Rubrobacteraceae bacterium TaxID=349277 RepID=A0A6J4R844_9ACTN|nr:helix-turn-helix domain-containing protein [uncultured Arthrobacter sp.]CAA9464159.1 MAG: Transcriptional regulator, ArsR family [uncultured Rubrobacteraceae bacterium]